MAPRIITGIDELTAAEGDHLGHSEWFEVTQDDIDDFADATRDRYWLHTDPDRAAASQLGSTIAHGLLTLSLGPMFTYSLVEFAGFAGTLNYGYDRVRFPAPLPVGSRVRMASAVAKVEAADAGGGIATFHQTFERDGQERPVCVADQVLRFLGRRG